jgi:NAD(P)H-flavin reductase/hemoglobin-like flavoprotein
MAREGDGPDGADAQRSIPGLMRGRLARTESSARLAEPGPAAIRPAPVSLSDRLAVIDSLPWLRASASPAMEYFYARLFAANPQCRALFPLSMTRTRSTTFTMLVSLIASLDDPDETDRLLDRLGRDHRKFGVRAAHYPPFFTALLATVEHFAGPTWTPELRRAWAHVLDYFSAVMRLAADRDAEQQPAWWIGEIVQHDRRTPTVAVLTIRPDKPLRYAPGQYVTVQVPKWPRLWRRYSIANAPRENGLIDLHVRAIPGGMVSTTLVSHCGTGDLVTLAAARGELTVPADAERDVVCVAGGTGLAPIKAIVEAIVGATRPGVRRSVTLYVGARSGSELYDMRDLATLRLAYPALTLIPVAEYEPGCSGRLGRLPEVVTTHPSFRNTDIYVAGPARLISATVQALARRVPSDRFHHDPLDALMSASLADPGAT